MIQIEFTVKTNKNRRANYYYVTGKKLKKSM